MHEFFLSQTVKLRFKINEFLLIVNEILEYGKCFLYYFVKFLKGGFISLLLFFNSFVYRVLSNKLLYGRKKALFKKDMALQLNILII